MTKGHWNNDYQIVRNGSVDPDQFFILMDHDRNPESGPYTSLKNIYKKTKNHTFEFLTRSYCLCIAEVQCIKGTVRDIPHILL